MAKGLSGPESMVICERAFDGDEIMEVTMCDLCGAEGRTSRWDIGHGVQAICDSCERNPQRVREEIKSRFPKVREVAEKHVATIRL